jgi:hypothetical protein
LSLLPEEFCRAAEERGFVVCGVISSQQSPWALPSEARSLVLLASTGKTFFQKFQESDVLEEQDPLDTYTKRQIEALVQRHLSLSILSLYYPFEKPFLPFQKLAYLMGWPRPGRLGLVVHPVYGPWVAMRAALALSLPLETAGEALPSLCLSCDAPCERACPVGAVGARGLDILRCGAARLHQQSCRTYCAAREHCVYGQHWRYSDDAIRYHHLAATKYFSPPIS